MVLGLYILGRLWYHVNRYTRTCSCILSYAGIVLVSGVSALSLCLHRNTIHASSSTQQLAIKYTLSYITLCRCLLG